MKIFHYNHPFTAALSMFLVLGGWIIRSDNEIIFRGHKPVGGLLIAIGIIFLGLMINNILHKK